MSLEWVNKPEPIKSVKRENPSVRHYNFKLLGTPDKSETPALTTTTVNHNSVVISSLPPKDGRSIGFGSSENPNLGKNYQSGQNTILELNDNKLVNPFQLTDAKTSAVFVATPAFPTTTTTTTSNSVKVSSLPPGVNFASHVKTTVFLQVK